MPFEVFDERRVPADRATPRVSVEPGRGLSFNGPAYELLGRPASVVFLFDAERRAIGLRAAELGAPIAYPVKQQGSSNSYRVSAKKFLRHCGLHNGNVRTSTPRLEGEIVVVEVEQIGNP